MAFDGETFVDRFNTVWNGHDIEGILAMMTDDVIFEASFGKDPWGARAVGKPAGRGRGALARDRAASGESVPPRRAGGPPRARPGPRAARGPRDPPGLRPRSPLAARAVRARADPRDRGVRRRLGVAMVLSATSYIGRDDTIAA